MFYILFMEHNNILGTVLAGGKSQRFGEDKSQILLADKTPPNGPRPFSKSSIIEILSEL